MKKRVSLKKFIFIVSFSLFALMILVLLTNIYGFSDSATYFCKRSFLFPNRISIVLSLLICISVSLLLNKNHFFENENKNIKLLIFGGSFLILIIQLTITFNVYFYTGWDAGIIRATVLRLLNHKTLLNTDFNYQLYYSRHPNNINLVAVFFYISKLFSFINFNGYFGLLIINNLIITITGVFTFLVSYKICQKANYAALSWILFIFLISFSPWKTIPYSDTFSVLFPLLSFYLYLNQKPQKGNLLSWFFIGFFAFLGYTIKPTAIIILFVIVIVEIIKIINKINKTLVKNNLIALSMIFISAVPVLIFNSLSRNTLGLELDKNQNFTFYHYIMTGLNNERQGAYLDEDVRFSSSFNTINERNSANITVIKERLSNFGFFGYINFLGRKALVNFSDGSFAWGCEGNFYADIPDREGLISTLFENIYYRNGIYHIYFLTIVQLLWFVVLILLFGLSIINNHNYNILALILTIITIFSFVMVFESRARYLLVYSPFFTIGAGIGANNISLWLSSMKNKIIKTG